MTKIAILQCPKCGKKQEVPLKEVQDNIQFNGHWWSCSNDCKWAGDEFLKRHGPDDVHVYLELVDVYDKDSVFIVYDADGGLDKFETEDKAKKEYNQRIGADFYHDELSLFWGRCLHLSKHLLIDEERVPQKEEIKVPNDEISQEDSTNV